MQFVRRQRIQGEQRKTQTKFPGFRTRIDLELAFSCHLSPFTYPHCLIQVRRNSNPTVPSRTLSRSTKPDLRNTFIEARLSGCVCAMTVLACRLKAFSTNAPTISVAMPHRLQFSETEYPISTTPSASGG